MAEEEDEIDPWAKKEDKAAPPPPEVPVGDRQKKFDPALKQRALGSVVSFMRGSSIGGSGVLGKGARYANSYKLESDKPFKAEFIEKLMGPILEEALDKVVYNPAEMVKKGKWITSSIRTKVKEQEYDRYKIVVICTVGEKKSQDVYSTLKCFWDPYRDNYAIARYDNYSIYAYAICFGLYYD